MQAQHTTQDGVLLIKITDPTPPIAKLNVGDTLDLSNHPDKPGKYEVLIRRDNVLWAAMVDPAPGTK